MKDRRELLKGLAVGSVWATPVVSSVMLPAHAATSCDFSGDYNEGGQTITVDGSGLTGVWNLNDRPDFFGVVDGCSATITFPDMGGPTFCATLEGGCKIQYSEPNQCDVVDDDRFWTKDDCVV